MKAQKSFLQKYWTYIVICSVLICSLGVLKVYDSHLKRKEFDDKLTMFKQPPEKSVEGGHWHADGTWHNEPHEETTPNPPQKMSEPHRHDSLSKEEHDAVHSKEHEELDRQYEEGKKEIERLKAEMAEDNRGYMEQAEFEKLIPNFQKRVVEILEVEDYDFISTYPSPSDILAQYPNSETLKAFCERLTKYQSTLKEISDEINARSAFAKRMRREYPDFMENLDKVSELEIPQLYAGGTQ